MNVLIILGSIMIIGGIGIYILGNKRAAPNAWLWALFPITHGIHEILEYTLDELGAPFVVERFELFFAIGSSFVLLAACIEFLGEVSKPYGKLSALVGTLFLTYFLFVSDASALEDLETEVYHFGNFTSDFYRFFFGFILVLVSIIAILISYGSLKYKERKKQVDLQDNITTTTSVAVVLLFIFSIFEGFSSTNSVFITLRGISIIFFLIVPAYVLISSHLGVQSLLIVHKDGDYVYSWEFNTSDDANRRVNEDEHILTANFISAISSFSEYEKGLGKLSEIATLQGSYIFAQKNDYIIALLTRNTSNRLEQNLIRLTNILPIYITKETDGYTLQRKDLDRIVQENLGFL